MAGLPKFGRDKGDKPVEASAQTPEGSTPPADASEPPKGRRARKEGKAKRGLSLAAFSDRSARLRLIIWATAGLFLVLGITIVALGVTSSYWFCANGCHKVQDDTIMAYQHSAHNRVSCMACHMPVGASPATFMLHKVEALGELYMTVTNNYELPLNAESEVSLTMKPVQCTQCHTTNRPITPSEGIVINHEVHAKEGIGCAVCHNRVAHREDFDLKGVDPATGKRNKKHEDFMGMSACFRCHSQAKDAKAPGACEACHPKGFELVPAFHKEAGFFPQKHGELAMEAQKLAAEAKAEEEKKALENGEQAGAEGAVAVAAESPATEGGHESLPSVASVNECFTCHDDKFCTDCHGTIMPHPADFKKQHGEIGKKDTKVCVQCHGSANVLCDKCHHGKQLGFDYKDNLDWRTQQHPVAVGQTGASACFPCHKPTYCAECHVNGGKPKK